jgi:hypothetical protein
MANFQLGNPPGCTITGSSAPCEIDVGALFLFPSRLSSGVQNARL